MTNIFGINILVAVAFAVSNASAGKGRNSIQLNWPWPDGESWNVGGTHGAMREGKYVWSALDINNFTEPRCRWNKAAGDTGCVTSTSLIYAMHSGTASRVSKCGIRIVHPSGWATSYYHMDDIKFKNGDYIKADQAIGRYAGDYETAVCEGGGTSAPHVHVSLGKISKKSGKFVSESLDGWLISGYKIKAGTRPYDKHCKRCNFQKDGRTFCPNWAVPRDDKHHSCESHSDCDDGLFCAGGYCKELCEEIIFASSGPAANVTKQSLGKFTKKGFRNGKMTYKNKNDYYLSFRTKKWVIQNKADFDGGNRGRLASTSCDKLRPNDCTGPWRVRDLKLEDNIPVHISCVKGGKKSLP